jgi:hypothetical protein
MRLRFAVCLLDLSIPCARWRMFLICPPDWSASGVLSALNTSLTSSAKGGRRRGVSCSRGERQVPERFTGVRSTGGGSRRSLHSSTATWTAGSMDDLRMRARAMPTHSAQLLRRLCHDSGLPYEFRTMWEELPLTVASSHVESVIGVPTNLVPRRDRGDALAGSLRGTAPVRAAGSDQVHHALVARLTKPNGRVIIGDRGAGTPLHEPTAACCLSRTLGLRGHGRWRVGPRPRDSPPDKAASRCRFL